jgi:ribosomal protein S18 acetylase RimI-like enzyme
MAVIATAFPTTASSLRPFNASRDQKAAVELVEMCFAGTLDPDGQSYLRQLRTSGGNLLADLGMSFGEPASLPNAGFVWEENQRIVGYVSLIPFRNGTDRCHLIANVSVHPDYRGRGIGRGLTLRSLEYVQAHRSEACWLQVREENAHAVQIYRTVGFIEQARRTTWIYNHSTLPRHGAGLSNLAQTPVTVGPRRAHHWEMQKTWLGRLYPARLSWHMPLNRQVLEIGLMAALYRFLMLEFPRQWSAIRNGQLMGVLSHQPSDGYADHLWLAAPPECDDYAIGLLLKQAQQSLPARRPVTINLPAGYASMAALSVGFQPQQTLLWMEYRF